MLFWHDRKAVSRLGAVFVVMCLAGVYFGSSHSRPAGAADENVKAIDDREKAGVPDEDAVKKEHEEYFKSMRQRAAAIKVRPLGSESDGNLIAEPLMRFSNQPYGTADATVWGWTFQGRLIGICKVIKRSRFAAHEGPWLYAFTSLSPELVESEFPSGRRYSAKQAGIEFKLVEKAAPPKEDKIGRLRQMKEIANRFTANLSDDILKTRAELRLLPRQLYRYDQPVGNILDGAIFAFANGTAPSLLLIVELHQTDGGVPIWNFAAAGSSWSRLSLKLDGNEVWTRKFVDLAGDYENWNSIWSE